MAHCLSHPSFGYYRHTRLGEDFVTAPMLGDVFGLIVGRWLVACWNRLGCPRDMMMVEAGAGGGELLGNALRVIRKLAPRCLESLKVHAVEINEGARERLAQAVSSVGGREFAVHETLEDVPHGRWFFVANEFFDALPVRQYLWRDGRSFVRRIALDLHRGGAALRFVRGEPCLLPKNLQESLQEIQTQQETQESLQEHIVETSPRALFLTANVAAVLSQHGGAAFVCDYGYATQRSAPRAGSLQAFFRHKAVDPLTHIGACDLSAEVDFDALRQTFQAELGERGECRVQTQRDFLNDVSMEDSLQGLSNDAPDKTTKNLSTNLQNVMRRLTDREQMGEKFKVLTVFAPTPP